MKKELYKNKKVLVTGGAGFIGSHLCHNLINEGCFVICLDDLSTGNIKNISGLKKNNRFTFIKHDIVDPIFLKIDQIYHLACPASPLNYQLNPVKTTLTSVVGTKNMLELAKKNKARLLFSSTSEVYGDPAVRVQNEKYWGNVNPIGIRSCYDEGKRCAESLCFDYHRQYQVDIRVVRIFNTYGPNMQPNDGRVVSNFIVQALKNRNLTIYGNGEQTRSFQYIDDLIAGLKKMMANNKSIGPINLGNPHEFTINQLAKKVIKMIPTSKSKIIYKSLPSDDPQRRKPGISRAKNILQWAPKYNLDSGLKKTIDYFKLVIN